MRGLGEMLGTELCNMEYRPQELHPKFHFFFLFRMREHFLPMSLPADSRKPTIVHDKLAIVVASSLLSLAAISWIATYYLMPLMSEQQSQSGMMMGFGIATIVSSPSFASVEIFEIIWIIGMAAMMFPAMIPIVLFYNKVATKQEPNPSIARSIGTPLFLGGYLIVYSVLGICAYLAVYVAISLSMNYSGLSTLSILASSAILVGTGIYQFTTVKSRCLKNCISPMGFFALHYKTGLLGSLRMGLTHGYYCVGCCWAFMLVMLGVGAMSLSIMAALAGVIALEKVIVSGAVWFNRLVGIAFIALGIVVTIFPQVLQLFSASI
jgi:predicted metal-binding membrane protein